MLLAAIASAAVTPLRAQQNAASSAILPNSTQAAAERRPYEDRVMEGVPPQEEVDLAVAEYNPQGWPRGISLQLTRNLQTFQNASGTAGFTRTDTQGIQIDAFVEAPNFGAVSLNLLALGGRNVTGLTSWSLRQTGLPFDGGWSADNALGITNLLVPDLARKNSRLALPATQVLGGSTIWRNEGSNALVIGASVGEPGRFEGFPQSRFVGLGGQVDSLFAQATEGEWTAAAAVAQGSNILPEVAPIAGGGVSNAATRVSPRGLYVGIGQNELATGASWQASAIGSQTSGVNATGIWADAIWRDGGHNHQVSIFRFTQGLTWIDRPLAADLQGGGYRYDYHSLRWDVSANIESFASVSGDSPSGWYGSTSVRRLITAGLSTGGGFAARDFGARSASGFAYLQWQNPLGISRVQLDAASTQGGPSSQTASFDHSVYAENGMSLTTSLGLERLQPAASAIDTQRRRENAVIVGLNGRALLDGGLYLLGSLRARDVRGAGVDSGTTLAANVGIDWQFSRDWSLGASLYENRGVLVDTIAVQSPLIVPEIIRARPNDRGVFLTLRYGSHAGSPSAPLGGLPGSGSGGIEGSVFLDSNGNGLRDGNESGAANVLVTLDGKFSTRTNAFGGFEFPSVVSGQHTLSVLQDDLPLPWSVDTDQKITAPISTRDTTHIDIGAKRMN